jgi:hypothetical protein
VRGAPVYAGERADRSVMQFIFQHEIGDAYLGAVSRLISNIFELCDTLLPQDGTEGAPTEVGLNQPYINLAT